MGIKELFTERELTLIDACVRLEKNSRELENIEAVNTLDYGSYTEEERHNLICRYDTNTHVIGELRVILDKLKKA